MFSSSADTKLIEVLSSKAMSDIDKLNRLNNEIKLIDYRLTRICSQGIEHFTDLKISTVTAATTETDTSNTSINASQAVID